MTICPSYYLFGAVSMVIKRTSFPPKRPLQLQALYLEIRKLDIFQFYIFKIIIVYCTKGCLVEVFLLLLKSSIKLKNTWNIARRTNFEHYRWKKQGFENLRYRFATTPFLYLKKNVPSTCHLWFLRYRTQSYGYEGFFESKTEWVSQNSV